MRFELMIDGLQVRRSSCSSRKYLNPIPGSANVVIKICHIDVSIPTIRVRFYVRFYLFKFYFVQC